VDEVAVIELARHVVHPKPTHGVFAPAQRDLLWGQRGTLVDGDHSVFLRGRNSSTVASWSLIGGIASVT